VTAHLHPVEVPRRSWWRRTIRRRGEAEAERAEIEATVPQPRTGDHDAVAVSTAPALPAGQRTPQPNAARGALVRRGRR
jgi:hypothetical protein